MVINHRCQQVVCRADRMEVTGEMQVDVFHRNNLCVSAAGCTALNAEYRAKGWLTKRYHNVLSKLLHSVSQTYGGRGLSFSCRSRVDRCYQNQFSVLFICLLQEIVIDLRFVLSVLLQVFLVNARFLRDFGNRLHGTFLCNFDV